MTRQYNDIQLEILIDRIEALIERSSHVAEVIKPQKIAEFNAAVEAADTMDEKLAIIDLWSIWFA